MYEAKIASLRLRHVSIRTLWLAAADYPRLLGCADVGVCLHYSSSGLDLPMKVVDMFGAGLPVCAVEYACLKELVRDGENGLVFSGAPALAGCLARLLDGFPGGDPSRYELAKLRRGIAAFQAVRWQDNWERNAAHMFR